METDEEKRKQIVLTYLKNRGYNQSVESFRTEARVRDVQDKAFSEQIAQESYVSGHILNYNIADVRPEKYEEYARRILWRRSFIESSGIGCDRPGLF